MAKNWMSRIDDDLIARIWTGTDRPFPAQQFTGSVSDHLDSGRHVPAAPRAEQMFVPVAQYRREDFKP